jgi:stage III sporulation protein SpoIIIAA
MLIRDDLQKLLDILPQEIRQVIELHPSRDSLIEVVMDLGRRPEARFRWQQSTFPKHRFPLNS